MVWDDAELALILARGGVPLLRFPADGFQLGVVAAIDDGATYDPFDTAPEGWETVTNAIPPSAQQTNPQARTKTGPGTVRAEHLDRTLYGKGQPCTVGKR